jgi:hypothetical protein
MIEPNEAAAFLVAITNLWLVLVRSFRTNVGSHDASQFDKNTSTSLAVAVKVKAILFSRSISRHNAFLRELMSEQVQLLQIRSPINHPEFFVTVYRQNNFSDDEGDDL